MRKRGELKKYINFRKYYIEVERQEEKNFHLNEIYNLWSKREKKKRCVNNLNSKKIQNFDEIGLFRFWKKEKFDTEIKEWDIVLISNIDFKKFRNKSFDNFSKELETYPLATVGSVWKNFFDVWISKPFSSVIFDKNLSLHLFINDITYKRQKKALDFMLQRKTEEWKDTIDFLLWSYDLEKSENFSSVFLWKEKFLNDDLNKYQKSFVKKSIENKYNFLHGPFWTGKTTSLIEAVSQCWLKWEKVLVAADSNTAVDNVLLGVDNVWVFHEWDIVRIWPMTRLYQESIYEYSIYKLIQKHKDYSNMKDKDLEIKKIKKQQDVYHKPVPQKRRGLSDMQIHRLASKGKDFRGIKSFEIKSMSNWLHLNKKIENLIQERQELREKIVEDVLDNAKVVFSTNSMVFSDLLEGQFFDVSFIDEAAQSSEPSTIMPIVVSDRFVLAWDHKQLYPTVMSKKAKPLEKSLFERLVNVYSFRADIYTLLKIQYRMNDNLMNFSNKMFYGWELNSDRNVSCLKISDVFWKQVIEKLKTIDNEIKNLNLYWFNVSDIERKDSESKSYYNIWELQKIKDLVSKFLQAWIKEDFIWVLSPYSAQVEKIKKSLEWSDIQVNTVDWFQWGEKWILLISYVRWNNKDMIWFLKDYRRLNVAITRTKRLLINVGNVNTLKTDKMFSQYFDYIKNCGKLIY